MASQNEIKKVLTRAVTDAGFRKRLGANPSAAGNELGVTFSAAEVRAIKDRSAMFSTSGAAIDRKISKAASLLAIWI